MQTKMFSPIVLYAELNKTFAIDNRVWHKIGTCLRKYMTSNDHKNSTDINIAPALDKTRTVRGSDYSPAVELSEQKEKLVTATGDTEKYSEKQANKVWLNSVYWFSRY